MSRRKKIVIFDEESRKEYLLGFSKRKKERRQKALDDIKRKTQQRIRQLKQKKREEVIEIRRKQQEEYDANMESEPEEPQKESSKVDATYEHPEHVVTVTTVCDVDLDGGVTTIGYNKPLPGISKPTYDVIPTKKEDIKEMKTQTFEKKTKKNHKNHKFPRKRSKEAIGSAKFQPKNKRKK